MWKRSAASVPAFETSERINGSQVRPANWGSPPPEAGDASSVPSSWTGLQGPLVSHAPGRCWCSIAWRPEYSPSSRSSPSTSGPTPVSSSGIGTAQVTCGIWQGLGLTPCCLTLGPSGRDPAGDSSGADGCWDVYIERCIYIWGLLARACMGPGGCDFSVNKLP